MDDIAQPITQPAKPDGLKFIFFIETLIFAIVVVFAVILFAQRKSVTNTKTSISPTLTPQIENKMNVPIGTKYENPFSEKTQYQNPFSKNTNPFDKLK
ncbi:hypothetical protein HY041_03520 [Candidatus Roizmanbacteria bacterium]|nr:hypothetical protein [Candidatus Roizmanbacteria bacterium]